MRGLNSIVEVCLKLLLIPDTCETRVQRKIFVSIKKTLDNEAI